jgi:hypothetical protein
MKARLGHLRGAARPYAYLRLGAILLITAVALPLLTGPKCGGPGLPPGSTSQVVGRVAGVAPAVSGTVNGATGPVAPAQPVDQRFMLFYPPPSAPAPVAAAATATNTVRYWPPTGALSPFFTGLQPDNPQGPPPFVFTGVPGSTPTELTAHYGAPELPEDRARYDVAEMCEVVEANGDTTAMLHFTTVTSEIGAAAGTESEPPLAPPAGRPVSAASAYSWWRPEFYFGVPGITMTTTLCNAASSYFQGGSFFVAARLPISDAAPAVPIVFRYGESGHYPSLDLIDESTWPPVTRSSLPLEVRHELLDWAENTLPRADGEHWTTLAPSPTASAACPSGLNLTSWEYYSAVPLDAGGDPGAWEEKVFPAYLCFVGSSAPPFVAQSGVQLIAGALDASGDADLITALGPFPIRLPASNPQPPFAVHSAGLRGVMPPQRVELLFMVENLANQTVTAAVTLKSKLRLPWKTYRGEFDHPDLARPITAPLTIARLSSEAVWAVVDVPAWVGGGETVTLTATEPATGHAAWNTGVVWLGSWPHVAHVVRRHLP